jgi:hypothetical protein
VCGVKKGHFAKLKNADVQTCCLGFLVKKKMKEQIGQIFEVWKFLNIEVSVIMEILAKKKKK